MRRVSLICAVCLSCMAWALAAVAARAAPAHRERTATKPVPKPGSGGVKLPKGTNPIKGTGGGNPHVFGLLPVPPAGLSSISVTSSLGPATAPSGSTFGVIESGSGYTIHPPPVPIAKIQDPAVSGAPITLTATVNSGATTNFKWQICTSPGGLDTKGFPVCPAVAAPDYVNATDNSETVGYTFALPKTATPTDAGTTFYGEVTTYATGKSSSKGYAAELFQVTVIPAVAPAPGFELGAAPSTTATAFDGAFSGGATTTVPPSGQIEIVPTSGDPNLLNSASGGIAQEAWDLSGTSGQAQDVVCKPKCAYNQPPPYPTPSVPGAAAEARARRLAAAAADGRSRPARGVSAVVRGAAVQRDSAAARPADPAASAASGRLGPQRALCPLCGPVKPSTLAHQPTCHGATLGEGLLQPDCAAFKPFIYNFYDAAAARVGLEPSSDLGTDATPMLNGKFAEWLHDASFGGLVNPSQLQFNTYGAKFLNDFSYLMQYYTPLGLIASGQLSHYGTHPSTSQIIADGTTVDLNTGGGGDANPDYAPYDHATPIFRTFPAEITETVTNTADVTRQTSDAVAFAQHAYPVAGFSSPRQPDGTPELQAGVAGTFDYSGVATAPGVPIAAATLELQPAGGVTAPNDQAVSQSENEGLTTADGCTAIRQNVASDIADYIGAPLPYYNQQIDPDFGAGNGLIDGHYDLGAYNANGTGSYANSGARPVCWDPNPEFQNPIVSEVAYTGSALTQTDLANDLKFTAPPPTSNVNQVHYYDALLSVYDADGLEGRRLITNIPVLPSNTECTNQSALQLAYARNAALASTCIGVVPVGGGGGQPPVAARSRDTKHAAQSDSTTQQPSIYYTNQSVDINGVSVQAAPGNTLIIDDSGDGGSGPTQIAVSTASEATVASSVGSSTPNSQAVAYLEGLVSKANDEPGQYAGTLHILAGGAASGSDTSIDSPGSGPTAEPVAQIQNFNQSQGSILLEESPSVGSCSPSPANFNDCPAVPISPLPGATYRSLPVSQNPDTLSLVMGEGSTYSQPGTGSTCDLTGSPPPPPANPSAGACTFSSTLAFKLQLPTVFGDGSGTQPPDTSDVGISAYLLPQVVTSSTTETVGAAVARRHRGSHQPREVRLHYTRRELRKVQRIAHELAEADPATAGSDGSPYAMTVPEGTELAGAPMSACISACSSPQMAADGRRARRPHDDGAAACPQPTDGTNGVDDTEGPLQFTYDPSTGDWCGRVDMDVPLTNDEASAVVIFHGSSLVYAELYFGFPIDFGPVTLGSPIDISIATDPTVFNADLGFGVGNDLISGQVHLTIQPHPTLFNLSGSVGLFNLITLGSFNAEYVGPGNIPDQTVGATTFSANAGASFGPASFNLSVSGGAGQLENPDGTAQTNNGQPVTGWFLQGSGSACLGPCIDVQGILSDKGVGACGSVDLVLAKVSLGASYDYGDGFHVLWGSCDFGNLTEPVITAQPPTGVPGGAADGPAADAIAAGAGKRSSRGRGRSHHRKRRAARVTALKLVKGRIALSTSELVKLDTMAEKRHGDVLVVHRYRLAVKRERVAGDGVTRHTTTVAAEGLVVPASQGSSYQGTLLEQATVGELQIVLHGQGNPPDVDFYEPQASRMATITRGHPERRCGRTFDAPSVFGSYSDTGDGGLIIEDTVSDTTTLTVADPCPGLWTWALNTGSAPVVPGPAGVQTAIGLPPLPSDPAKEFDATLGVPTSKQLGQIARRGRLAERDALRGKKLGGAAPVVPPLEKSRVRALTFSVPSSTLGDVTFVSRGATGMLQPIGTAAPGQSGTMTELPGADSGQQTVEAILAGANGAPRAAVPIATYTAPEAPTIPQLGIANMVRYSNGADQGVVIEMSGTASLATGPDQTAFELSGSDTDGNTYSTAYETPPTGSAPGCPLNGADQLPGGYVTICDGHPSLVVDGVQTSAALTVNVSSVFENALPTTRAPSDVLPAGTMSLNGG
jgi:hypothetical protein